MRESKGSLWCSVLQGKYGRNREVNGELIAKTTDSFIWKGIVKVMDNISQFEEWSVGNGTSISAWRDKWLGDNIVLAQNVESIPENVINWKVADMVNEMGDWKIDELNALLPIAIINKIKALPPPQNTDGANERVWPGDRLGQFDIASAYKLLCAHREQEVDAMWNFIWKLEVPERVRCFV
ncbi:hypothetical protein QL285_057330 [Trifolium repens]|nr:hypothetical protein QL285_057330 [Trifolium repens]